MTDNDHTTYDEEHEGDDREQAATSILDQLAHRRAELAKTKPYLHLDVPGYDGRLVLRCQYPTAGYKALVRAATTAASSRDPEAQLNAACDTILSSVDTLYGRDAEGQAVHLYTDRPLDETVEIEPRVRFVAEFATKLGIVLDDEVKSPGRFILREVFSPRAQETGEHDGDVALMAMGGRVMAWLQDTSANVSEEFQGES